MESESSLKEHLRQMEKKLLKPEIRISQKELNNLLAVNFLNLEVLVKSCTKMRGLVKKE